MIEKVNNAIIEINEGANKVETNQVYNDWDIYVISNHIVTSTSNGANIIINIIVDIPSNGKFLGLDSIAYDANKKLVEFVLDRSNNGGPAGSRLSTYSINVTVPNQNAGTIHYYGFRYKDTTGRKKVVSADPANRPK